MKAQYDFSHGERGKFYHPDAEFHLPIYLEPDIAEFLQEIAMKKQIAVDELVNSWLRKDIELVRTTA